MAILCLPRENTFINNKYTLEDSSPLVWHFVFRYV